MGFLFRCKDCGIREFDVILKRSWTGNCYIEIWCPVCGNCFHKVNIHEFKNMLNKDIPSSCTLKMCVNNADGVKVNVGGA